MRGIGKTALVEAISNDLNISRIHVSRELIAYCQSVTGFTMLGVDVSTRDRIREEYGDALATRLGQYKSTVALDLHLSDYREGGKIIQPRCMLEVITNLVVLDASLEAILNRRILDHSKVRVLDIEEMKREKSVFDAVVEKVVKDTELPCAAVNAEGGFAEIVQRLEYTVTEICMRS